MYKDCFFKWMLKASVISFLFVSFATAEDEDEKTEAQGHGVCSYCSEVAPPVSINEDTNPNSVLATVNAGSSQQTEKEEGSKGLK